MFVLYNNLTFLVFVYFFTFYLKLKKMEGNKISKDKIMLAKYTYSSKSIPSAWDDGTDGNLELSRLIKIKWNQLHDATGILRYKIDVIKEKQLGARYLLQLNPDRGSKRRIPESFDNICQRFDPQLFNFTKVLDEEIILNVINDKKDDNIHSILVNVSPISRYHSLICPSINKCLPQVVTVDSLKLVLEIMFLCQDRDIRIGFNSLCAFASVNHLHYHILVERNNLPVEYVKCKHIAGEIYCFDNSYPVPAFCFQIKRAIDIVNISEDTFKLIEYFLSKNVAHNILITRGKNMKDGTSDVIRVVVWPRKSSFGIKVMQDFNVAVCELSGWFPIYDENCFNNIQITNLENEIKKWQIENFEEICEYVKLLFMITNKC